MVRNLEVVEDPLNPGLLPFWLETLYRNLDRKCRECCFYASLWSLWIPRNELVFRNMSIQSVQVAELVKTRVALWIKGKHNIRLYSVDDFRRCLDGVLERSNFSSIGAGR